MTESILQDAWQFLKELFENLRTGILFFGGPYEIFLAMIDILITTLVIYFVLKLIRDSRAWQLLKGILLIVVLAQIFTIMGLQTIGFILSSTLSVLAIAFVVLFQPELRRALETVGRNSFTFLSGVIGSDTQISKNMMYSTIDAIVRACEKMAETGTGALIIIEREARLSELAEQDNAVVMDSAVSATLLLQIFYKGSPLHDGAVLIRNGRINAARCHVPLSDNYHLRKDFGTRHRAAIGVSEMGDAIAVVVSEERKAISIAIDGRLYVLDNADALRTILHKQLDEERQGVISNLIKNTKIKKTGLAQKMDLLGKKAKITMGGHGAIKEKIRLSKRKNLAMILSSLLIAIFIWIYVQVTVNPVDTKSYTIPITTEGVEQLALNGLRLETVNGSVTVSLMGRSRNLSNLDAGDITALIDVSKITSATSAHIPVTIKIRKLPYFRTVSMNPDSFSVVITEIEPSVTPTPTVSITPAVTTSPASSDTSAANSAASTTTTANSAASSHMSS